MSVAEPAKNGLTEQQVKQNNLRGWLSSTGVIDQLKMVLPKHLTPDRFVRVVLTASIKNPTLLQCTKESIWMSVLNAATTGLEMDGYEGHMIPYKNKGRMEAQFQADYKGLVKLAYQSEMVRAITARAVYSGDEFKYKLGTNQFIDHIPCEDPKQRGTLKYAYAICELANGGYPLIVLNRAEVMAHKAAGTGSNSSYSPWNKAETEPAMWAKTAFRELSKFIPRSSSLQRALQIESEADINFGREAPILLNQDEEGGNDERGDSEQGMLPAPSKTDSLTEQLESARSATEAREKVPVRSSPTKQEKRREAVPEPTPGNPIGNPEGESPVFTNMKHFITYSKKRSELDPIADEIKMSLMESDISQEEAAELRRLLKSRLEIMVE